MYVPEAFRLDDADAIAEIAEAYAFALLVTAADGVPAATHLPVIYEPEGGPHGRLLGHLARPNPQAEALARLAETGGEALVVFQGPHAYVSPTWYGDDQQVPTWNYLAVHAYGAPRLIDGEGEVRALLQRLTVRYESHRARPWTMDMLPEALMRGIVAFEMPVARLEAKAKLNQNKPEEARRGAVAGLEGEGDAGAAELAAWMRRLVLGGA